MKLFGVDIAKELAKGMGNGLLPAQLLKSNPGTRESDDLSDGTHPTERKFACRGILEDYDARFIDGTSVLNGDKRVLLLGGTLPAGVVPEPGDHVKIENLTYRIIQVKRDPAAATYTCQSRG